MAKISYGALTGKVHTVKEICIEKQAVNAKEEILCVREVQLKKKKKSPKNPDQESLVLKTES